MSENKTISIDGHTFPLEKCDMSTLITKPEPTLYPALALELIKNPKLDIRAESIQSGHLYAGCIVLYKNGIRTVLVVTHETFLSKAEAIGVAEKGILGLRNIAKSEAK